ncbi:MAG: DUF3291 domain-containing protein [Acidobacteriia bacterium]|nr:DUF3291 domain-containing protein [Terriglobia bacterium]
MMRVAFATFAILQEPYGHPTVQEFDDRTPDVFKEAEGSEGFIARAKEVNGSELSNFERDWGAWGPFRVPRFYTLGRETNTDQRASTISLWKDLPSVFQFVYAGLHLEAFKKRTQWFKKPEWPTYAIWWVEDDHIPTWEEASRMLEQLHDEGPSPIVFDFKACFDETGNPVKIASLKAKPAEGAAPQKPAAQVTEHQGNGRPEAQPAGTDAREPKPEHSLG